MAGRTGQVKLTKTDRVILESYIPVVQDLAVYLGSSYEIVLHSLEDYDHSVIAIVNGAHTGRTVGAPITDLALDMLDVLSQGKPSTAYFSTNKKGEPLKSTTIAIRGEHDRIVGLLCINLYLNTSLSEILADLTPDRFAGVSAPARETFASNTGELIEAALDDIRARVMQDASILPSNKNKAIVEELYDKGMFRLKDAVVIAADLLGISKNTIYMHIRNYRKACGPEDSSRR